MAAALPLPGSYVALTLQALCVLIVVELLCGREITAGQLVLFFL